MMQFMIGLDIYLISEKSAITYSISHNSARIKIDSYNYLPKWMYFYIEDDDLLEKFNLNLKLFVKKSARILKNKKKNK